MALPSAPVDHAAFAALRDEIVAGLRAAGPLDGVFLELHGAMATDEADDAGGGASFGSARSCGTGSASLGLLDLHANMSRRMVAMADHIDAYRTYPHIDMRESGTRDDAPPSRAGRGAPRRAAALREVPVSLAAHGAGDVSEPMTALPCRPPAEVRRGLQGKVILTLSFPLADVAANGPAIRGLCPGPGPAEALADEQRAMA